MRLPFVVIGALALAVVAEEATHTDRLEIDGKADVAVALGSSITLKCIFKGIDAQDLIMWRKRDTVIFADEENMESIDRYSVTLDTMEDGRRTAELTIKGAQVDDDSSFECGVSDPEEYREFKLQVEVAPRVHISPHHVPYVVRKGEEAHIRCIAKGNPMPKVHWSKKPGSFSSRLTIEGQNGDVIRIPNAEIDDSGVYTCFANSTVGHTSADISLRIEEARPDNGAMGAKPWVKIMAPFLPAKRGQTFNLTCEYDGSPSPNVDWMFNGYPISGTNEIVQQSVKQFAVRMTDRSKSILQITEIDEPAFGDYACKASNQHGNASAVVMVSPTPGPPMLEINGPFLTVKMLANDDINEIVLFHHDEFENHWLHNVVVKIDPKVNSYGNNVYGKVIDLREYFPGGLRFFQAQGRSAQGYGARAQDGISTDVPIDEKSDEETTTIEPLDETESYYDDEYDDETSSTATPATAGSPAPAGFSYLATFSFVILARIL